MAIAIVGAGIAGLCLAAGLQRAGLEVVVLEEREALSGGAGITLWPNALSTLDDLGLGDAVRAAGKQVGAEWSGRRRAELSAHLTTQSWRLRWVSRSSRSIGSV